VCEGQLQLSIKNGDIGPQNEKKGFDRASDNQRENLCPAAGG
jgi:hypothetical protein